MENRLKIYRNNPKYFNASMVNDAIANWVNVESQCLQYVAIASDGPPPPHTLNLLSVHLGVPQETSTSSIHFFASAADSPPPPYDARVDPTAKKWFNPATAADRAWKFTVFFTAQQDDSLLEALKAPQFTLACNRGQLNSAAAQYSQAGSVIV